MTRAETSPSLAAIVAAIDGELPSFRGQTSPDGMVTIGFTDIEGSTNLIEMLAEARWLELMLAHSRIVRGYVSSTAARS